MSTTTLERYRVVDDGTDIPRWLKARHGFIGASQSAAILGLSKYSTPLDVWKSMQPDAEPIEENRFTTWGTRLESVVAEWSQVDYGDILGKVLPSPGLLASIDYPFISATPDRELEIDGEVQALEEIKTGSEYTKDHWFEEFTGKDVAPMWYEVQVQQQLFVRGFKFGYIVPLIGGNDLLRPRLVTYDQQFIDILLDTLSDWYETYIVKNTPPPATRLDDLKSLFPGVNGTKIDATPAIVKLVAERNVLQPKMSSDAKRDKEIKGDLQAFMGDATDLIDPDTGAVLVTWRRGLKDKEYFAETEFAIEHPDLYRAFRRTKEPGRTMLFK
jgi:putative phage-type endonuclease